MKQAEVSAGDPYDGCDGLRFQRAFGGRRRTWSAVTPRARRASSVATPAEDSQSELEQLKQRKSELRGLLRKSRTGGTEVRKLEQKLEKQFAAAKWTVGQIRAIQPDWDDVGFCGTVKAVQPTPRGRRPRSSADG